MLKKTRFVSVIVIAVVFALIVPLAGCKGAVTQETVAATSEIGTKITETTTETSGTVKEEAKSEEIYVALTPVWGVPYFIDFRWGWEDAGKALGVTVEYTGHDDLDPVVESRMMDELIVRKVNGIALNVCVAEAMNPAIDRAMDAGIPVVTWGSDTEGSKRIAYCGQINYEHGVALAEALAKAVDYKGEVGISYAVGNISQEERFQAYKDVIAKYPDMKLAQAVNDGFDLTTGVAAISAMLQTNTDIVGLGGCNATSGACAAQAVMEAGKKPGEIKVIAVDNNDDVLNYIKNGWIDRSIATRTYFQGFSSLYLLYQSYHAKELMPHIAGWLDAGLYPAPVFVDTGLIEVTKENADLFFKGE